jgi:predicted amidophosphoribosyltransferase
VEWLWSSECAGCGVIGLGRLCYACRGVDVRRMPSPGREIAGAFTLGRYTTPLGGAVRRAKVARDLHLAEQLGRLYARRLAPHVETAGFSAIVAAQSTAASLVRRGFSLASVLAHALARESGIPETGTLRRHGGRRQATLSRSARRANVAGRLVASGVAGRVLLVDDVVTTGATARACAAALRAAGAAEVWLAVVVAAVDDPIRPLPDALPPLRIPLRPAAPDAAPWPAPAG